ncbi:DNA cytosine methyltransferase [Deinococcus aquaticus]|uniref:DNA cytosine methyltransferase n=1 Tax=Deinococcus aquaticus TaxID=328692 RepID=UPI0030A84BF1
MTGKQAKPRNTVQPPKPTAFDVFAGAGGLSLGLKQAGFNVIGAVELEPTAAETYQLNHPKVRLWNQDVQTLEADEILRALNMRKGDLGLLAGCPPCQGFSGMRTRNGKLKIEDARNDLVIDFLRLVEGLRPKAVMLENVPDLSKDERMTQIIDRLRELGYYTGEDCFQIRNVKHFDVPQSRRRLILMTTLAGKVDFPEPIKRARTVRGAIGKLPVPELSDDPLHNHPASRSDRITQMIEAIPRDGGSRSDLPENMQLECHKKLRTGFADVYGRMSWEDVAPTITGGCTNPSKGRFLHPEQHRSITVREAALLQGFPPTYQFSMKRGKVFASLMVGNALPPAFVRHHAKVLARRLADNQSG